MKRLFKNPIVIGAIAFIGGVVSADKVKPMLAQIPVIGKFFGGTAE